MRTDGPEQPAPSRADAIARVALVIDSLAPGGGERVVTHLAGGLRRRGVGVEVVCLRAMGGLGEALADSGATVHCLHSTRGRDLKALWRLRGLLRTLQPDAINVHDRSSLPYVVLANWLATRGPVVYTAHGLLFNAAREPGKRYRRAMRGARLMTAVSREVARRHVEHLAWTGPVEIVPNGVPDAPRDLAARRALREQIGIAHDEAVFLAVGNARPEKAFEDLLDAAAALRARTDLPPWRVLVAGGMPDGPYVRDLRSRHDRLALGPAVTFLGYRTDTAALYSAADAFVLCSRSEGLPMVVLEAMMAELPVVATRVGGVAAAVGEEAGLLVDPARPDQLAQAMRRLVADPAARATLGDAARRRALAEHGMKTMVDRYLAAYAHAAGAKGERA